jgi:hypothetical protein
MATTTTTATAASTMPACRGKRLRGSRGTKKLDAGKFELPSATSPGERHLVVSDAIFEAIHKGVAITPRAARRRVH